MAARNCFGGGVSIFDFVMVDSVHITARVGHTGCQSPALVGGRDALPSSVRHVSDLCLAHAGQKIGMAITHDVKQRKGSPHVSNTHTAEH